MEVYIYLILAILFLSSALFIVQRRLRSIKLYPQKYEKIHNGHEAFILMIFATIRYFLRRGNAYFKFYIQYIQHLWVKFLSFISNLFDKVYAKSRDKFVRSAVSNKSTVPHFWNSLKKYKKEIDEEKENKIDDTGLDKFTK